ncbi:MAG: type 4a pilus biogenesis protein PilO [Candidatus Roizmanbacteria bacterium]
MDTVAILKKAFNKGVRDYTYIILFFLIASFFVFFVIRPVLAIAISLQKESKDLKEINVVYERNINTIISLQSQLEEIRPLNYLFEAAFPQTPRLDGVLTDIREAAVASNVKIESLEADDVSYETQSKASKISPIEITLRVKSDYDHGLLFIQKLLGQRRLKTLDKIRVSNVQKNAVSSGSLQIDMVLSAGFY